MNTYVDSTLQQLATLLGTHTFVLAGGAVRDVLRNQTPKDYDLFLLGTTALTDEQAARVAELEQVEPMEGHRSEPFLQATVHLPDVHVGLGVDTGGDWQIMCTPYHTVEELLDSFDWNISKFAYDGTKVYQRMLLDDIGPGKALELGRITFPQSTLRRGYRYSERFQMKLAPKDVTRLCLAVLATRLKVDLCT